MRGRTGSARAPRSTYSLLCFLPGGCSLYWLALIVVLMSCGLSWGPFEGTATAGQPSAAENEVGPSDRATSPATGVATEPLSSGETEEGAEDSQIDPLEPILLLHRASDPEIDPKEQEALIERAFQIVKKQEAEREAARSASQREAYLKKKEWPAPLPELVYKRLLYEKALSEQERVLIPDLQLESLPQSATSMSRGLLSELPPELTINPSFDLKQASPLEIMTDQRRGRSAILEDSSVLIKDWRGPPSLSELVNEYVLYDYLEPTAPILAAIELRHNESSFKLLLKYALKDYVKQFGHSDGGHWESPAVEALWFLRTYDPTEEARGKVENALQLDLQQSQEEGPVANQAAERAKYLKSLLASWDFAKGLSDTRRKAYQDYERRRWMAWSLARSAPSRGVGGPRVVNLGPECPWPEGDEEFFLRNFESPASTVEEVRHSGYIAFLQPDGTYRFSDDGIRRLEAVAEGDSAWAEYAAKILPRLKNQEEQ